MVTDFSAERREMRERQLGARGIDDPRVLAAMDEIPREEFVPQQERATAYRDAPIPIGYGQTISQPYMTALMAQELGLNGYERVLEVGTGSGYAAAVLGLLAREVVSVELIPELAEAAIAALRRTGLGRNVRVIAGDGSWGMAEMAPYDGISVAAAAPDIPESLLAQLGDPGRLVIPVGPAPEQELVVIRKERGRLTRRVATPCSFVPLLGGNGWRP